MTSTFLFRSNARYSATVSAARGVMIRSMMGSLARFNSMTTRSIAPQLSKLSRKYDATSFLTPIAANTMAKSDPSATLA